MNLHLPEDDLFQELHGTPVLSEMVQIVEGFFEKFGGLRGRIENLMRSDVNYQKLVGALETRGVFERQAETAELQLA